MKLIVDNNKNIKIDKDGEILKQYSNKSSVIEFEFGDRWTDFNKYIEFEGKGLNKISYLLTESVFRIPSDITEVRKVTCDIAFKTTDGSDTIKDFSKKWNMTFDPSINANVTDPESHRDIIDYIITVITQNTNAIEQLGATKVDKVSGKGLSTNDFTDEYKGKVDENTSAKHTHSNKSVLDNTTASYTTEEKTKLQNIESGAEVNVLEKVMVNGVEQEIESKGIDLAIPTKVSDLDDDSGHYTKPSGGIPSTDMTTAVQTSLGKADTALQEHQDVTGKEDKTNKVTELSAQSTNTQYPGAKCVYDYVNATLGNIETELEAI